MDINQETLDYEEELIALRRHFHRHPERSWEENETQNAICRYLTEQGIPFTRVCKTGVIGTIEGKKSKTNGTHWIGIRADIDALPITEETGCAYQSENSGVMHACGHDTHIAILLAAARLLQQHRDELTVGVRLIFQPAEEYIQDSGATYMKDEPLVKACDRIIGLHIWGMLPAGTASIMDGPIMASADTFDITITGRGGHGAHPNECIDPIPAGAELVSAVNRVMAREVDPLTPSVISITSFQAGTTFNVIPDTAVLRGTARAASPALRERYESILKRLCDGVALSTGTKIHLDYHYGVSVTVNDPPAAETGRRAAAKVFGSENVKNIPFTMGGEDFSKYTNEKAFLILGGGHAEESRRFAQHNPHFDIDEGSLKLGVRYFLHYVEEWEKELEDKRKE